MSGTYAIVATGGHQEKVSVGDQIEINRLDAKPGDSVELTPVLFVSDGKVASGDELANISVTAEVLDHHRGPKISIMRYKNKTRYRRRQGHRQELCTLRVTDIKGGN